MGALGAAGYPYNRMARLFGGLLTDAWATVLYQFGVPVPLLLHPLRGGGTKHAGAAE